jgi:hypothetical protein
MKHNKKYTVWAKCKVKVFDIKACGEFSCIGLWKFKACCADIYHVHILYLPRDYIKC